MDGIIMAIPTAQRCARRNLKYLIVATDCSIYLLTDRAGRCEVLVYLLVATDAYAGASSSVSRLHLEHGPEQDVGRGRQELDLGVRMESVEVRTLGRQRLVDERVVAGVVAVRRHWKPWSEVQLAVHLSQ